VHKPLDSHTMLCVPSSPLNHLHPPCLLKLI
jgi:hypothetical protein